MTIVYFGALVLGRQVGGRLTPGGAVVFVVAAFLASASWQLLIATGGTLVGRLLDRAAGSPRHGDRVQHADPGAGGRSAGHRLSRGDYRRTGASNSTSYKSSSMVRPLIADAFSGPTTPAPGSCPAPASGPSGTSDPTGGAS